jgi:hypothetical protein
MTRNTDRNNVKPVLFSVAFMVMVLARLISATAAPEGINAWKHSFFNCMCNRAMRAISIWMIGSASFSVLSISLSMRFEPLHFVFIYFWVCLIVIPLIRPSLLAVIFAPFARLSEGVFWIFMITLLVIGIFAVSTPSVVAVASIFVFSELTDRLRNMTFTTSLFVHGTPNKIPPSPAGQREQGRQLILTQRCLLTQAT